jgi:type I restriction enzyme S subunit
VSELPKGWVQTKFTDTLDVNGGTQPPKSQFVNEPQEGYIRLLQIRDFGKKPVPTYIPDNGKRRICTKEDILIGRYGASIGRICTGMEGAFNVALARVAKPKDISSGYLKYFLQSHLFQDPLSMLSRSAQNGFNKQDLAEFNFPLAPLNEQIRIADKLDSMLTKVAAAQARLDKIPNILKRFRQSVLAAATSGELTKEWRGGSEQQWPRVLLKSVGAGFNYGTSTKSKPEGDVPVLRMGNLQGGQLDWEKLVYTSDKSEIEKYLLEAGDVLFNRTNSPELVGKSSIFRGERKAIYAGYLIRVKGSERLNTEFLNIQLNSPHARDYCWQVKTDGVSQSNINAKKLQAYEFDLPKIDEQLEIVRRVGELFSHAGLFERQYQIAKKKCNRLTQSILAKAFRGQLVEQDENDEPAVKLLSRIQSEPKSQPKNIVKRTANKSVDKNMKLEDAPENYLKNLMPSDESEIQAKQLWQDSNMTIDDFYTQLKKELINIEEINNSLDPNARTLKTSKE